MGALIYTNIKETTNLPFDTYLSVNGYSHSFLKSQKNGVAEYFNPSDKVKLGSLVDALLTQDDRVDFSSHLYNDAVKIASAIKEEFGWMIKSFVCQPSYTATVQMQTDGGLFELPVKGRLDWRLGKTAVIDLKVTQAKTDKEFSAIINHLGYNNQLWHYAKLSGCGKAYIMPYSASEKRMLSIVKVPVISMENEFWDGKVLEFGSVK
jgi:hypothetical protein